MRVLVSMLALVAARLAFASVTTTTTSSTSTTLCINWVPSCSGDLGPPGVCSNVTHAPDSQPGMCSPGYQCGQTGQPNDPCECPCADPNHCQPHRITDCANNEDTNPTCIRWPFIDANNDGCFDADTDLTLSFLAIHDVCYQAYLDAKSGSSGACPSPSVGTRPVCTYTEALSNAAGTSVTISCQYNTGPEYPRTLINIDSDFGLTTPAEMKCYDGTAMLQPDSGVPLSNKMKRDNTSVNIRVSGDFRNYAWGAWKNHYKGSRLSITARNIIMGGVDIPNTPPAGTTHWLPTETNMNWDEDTVLHATGSPGCILGGSYTGTGSDNEVRINEGPLTINAPSVVSIPDPWSLTATRISIIGCDILVSPPVIPAVLPPGSCLHECDECCEQSSMLDCSDCPCP